MSERPGHRRPGWWPAPRSARRSIGPPGRVGRLVLGLLAGALAAVDCQPDDLDIRFEEVTQEAGLDHAGRSWTAAWGDLNRDGYPDLFAGNHGDLPSLYVNQGNGQLVDLGWLLGDRTGDFHGAAWADFDNDGDQDLLELVGASGGLSTDPNRLFVNSGVLVESAAQLGVDNPLGRGRHPMWWDWNRDGRLDAVLNGVHRSDLQDPPALFVQGHHHFEVSDVLPETTEFSRFVNYSQLLDIDDDGELEMLSIGSGPGRIYELGGSSLVDVAAALGVPSLKRIRDTAIGDFDGDGQLELYASRHPGIASDLLQVSDTSFEARVSARTVSNADEITGFEFATTGDVTFAIPGNWIYSNPDIFIGAAGSHPSLRTFTLSPDDPAHHGLADFENGPAGAYFGFDPGRGVWEVRTPRTLNVVVTSTSSISAITPIGFTPVMSDPERDLLFDLQDGQLVEVARSRGLGDPTECGNVTTADFDNDMDLDLYLVCSGPLVNLANRYFENQGDGSFAELIGGAGAPGSTDGIGNVVAVADYDLDGFLDLFVNNGEGAPPFHDDGPHQLYRNRGNANHWIMADLEGVETNRDGLGARVLVRTGEVWQRRDQLGGVRFGSQDHVRIHFGLGPYEQVDEIRVEWPTGRVQTLTDVSADQVLRLIEPAAPSPLGRPPAGEALRLWKESWDGPYHLEVSESGPSYRLRLVSREPVESLAGVGLEPSDGLAQDPGGFDFTSETGTDGDRIEFVLSPNARALLAVEQDDTPAPRRLHVGAAGLRAAPVGWIRAEPEWGSSGGEGAPIPFGLTLGRASDDAHFEASWTGGPGIHPSRFEIIASAGFALAEVDPARALEPGEVSIASERWLSITSEVDAGDVDGVRIRPATGSQLGVRFTQDQTFPWPRVMSPLLGLPNAVALPVASPIGEPAPSSPPGGAAFEVWLDAEGFWNLRIGAASAPETFSGRLRAEAAIESFEDADLASGDSVTTTSLNSAATRLASSKPRTDWLACDCAVTRKGYTPGSTKSGPLALSCTLVAAPASRVTLALLRLPPRAVSPATLRAKVSP